MPDTSPSDPTSPDLENPSRTDTRGRTPARDRAESQATRAIHGLSDSRAIGQPVIAPLVQSATFFGGGPDDSGALRYSRYGNNPGQLRVSAKVAALEGMEAGLALGSGMAGISLTLLSLVRHGDHVVSSRQLYGATRDFMSIELPRRGVRVSFVDPDDEGTWKRALQPRTRLLYLEMPTNPTLRLFDPRPVGRLAQDRGIPLVMDTTMASPMNFQGGRFGADMVIHSATKYLAGHSDVIAGAVAGSAERIRAIQELLRLYGPALDPHAAWLLERGMKTLDVRMERHGRNAMTLARRLERHPRVERVVYPGLPSHRDHALAEELLDGFGGMLGLVLTGGEDAAEEFCRRLEVAAVAPSLGGVETLVSLPRLTSHRSLSADEREAVGIPPGFVRISVGIEGCQDLEMDLIRALEGDWEGRRPGLARDG